MSLDLFVIEKKELDRMRERIAALEEALRSALNMVDGDGRQPDWDALRALVKPE